MKNKICCVNNLFNYELRGFIRMNIMFFDNKYDKRFSNHLIKGMK